MKIKTKQTLAKLTRIIEAASWLMILGFVGKIDLAELELGRAVLLCSIMLGIGGIMRLIRHKALRG